ncbi:hypothetical protein [Rhizobium straminoryzae]|uniref:Uncharacterized protein n=1 Tax=Rhizobium straminoryzae TaxID=1387186 RepID=A0A549T867_9HYPH|nr:hypothetical protein [Rhizobium straminoryzae]TRL38046.1 hypothetical protein FNA46_13645 [Rhizobium straminoryzae]
MGVKKKKAVGLLNRIQFIDLAQAVTQSPVARREWLRAYLQRALKGGKFPSYRYFRNAIPTIYGVKRGLDPSPPVGREELKKYVGAACNGIDEAKNVEAALTLYDLIRPRGYLAYDHEPRHLALGRSRQAAIGLQVELVREEELIFQYPYPRRSRLDDHTIRVLLSIIHHAYAVGDREGAFVELADLSCDFETAETRRLRLPSVRAPRIIRIHHDEIISLDDLAPEVQNVHDLLMELGEEPD